MEPVDFAIFTSLDSISRNFGISVSFLEYMFEKKYITEHSKSKKHVTNDGVTIGFHEISLQSLDFIDIPKKNPKKRKQFRTVVSLPTQYSRFYKNLLYDIERVIKKENGNINEEFISNSVHGFVIGRNTLTNAKQHLDKQYILKIDIKSFFQSIFESDLVNVFKKIGCNQKGADLFARLCSVNGKLQEGLNTSPMLANIHCLNLDKELENLSENLGLTYTRYSDDITFSSDANTFPSIDQLETLLKKFGFKINSDKICFAKKGQPQYVTGLNISDEFSPRIPPQIKKRIRKDLYYIRKFGIVSHFEKFNIEPLKGIRTIYGQIVYIIGIERALGRKLKTEFLSILAENDLRIEKILVGDIILSNSRLKYQIFHYVDETEFTIGNNSYIALSVVSIPETECNIAKEKLETLKNLIRTDRYSGIEKEKIEDIFHFSNDNIRTKEKYITLLKELQFEAFIAFTKYEGNYVKNKNVYQDNYYYIFQNLFYNILPKYKHYLNRIYYEVNSKISKKALIKSIQQCLSSKFDNITPAKKDNILLSIPDYILGFFRKCMKKELQLFEEYQFEEVHGKISFIIDIENKKYYSRRKLEKFNCREFSKNKWQDFS